MALENVWWDRSPPPSSDAPGGGRWGGQGENEKKEKGEKEKRKERIERGREKTEYGGGG